MHYVRRVLLNEDSERIKKIKLSPVGHDILPQLALSQLPLTPLFKGLPLSEILEVGHAVATARHDLLNVQEYYLPGVGG